MNADDFRVSLSRAGTTATVECRGELDVATTSQLAAAVDASLRLPPRTLHIDCTALTFIASEGFDVLLETVRRCLTRDVAIEISFNARARTLIRLLDLNDRLLPEETRRLGAAPPHEAAR